MTVSAIFLRADQVERRFCIAANAAARRRVLRAVFRGVSRLGDGVFWYLLMGILPLALGATGIRLSLQMLVTGIIGFACYRLLKRKLVRERPFVGLVGVECAMPPLDRYSFPSGHTLHAVMFTAMAIPQVPQLSIVLVPFTMLVAGSRVVLGLHYPSDVLAGAALGGALAALSNWLVG